MECNEVQLSATKWNDIPDIATPISPLWRRSRHRGGLKRARCEMMYLDMCSGIPEVAEATEWLERIQQGY